MENVCPCDFQWFFDPVCASPFVECAVQCESLKTTRPESLYASILFLSHYQSIVTDQSVFACAHLIQTKQLLIWRCDEIAAESGTSLIDNKCLLSVTYGISFAICVKFRLDVRHTMSPISSWHVVCYYVRLYRLYRYVCKIQVKSM